MEQQKKTELKTSELMKIYNVSRTTIQKWKKDVNFLKTTLEIKDKRLLRPKDIMHLLQGSRPTFLKWKRSKHFPNSVKVGSREYWIYDEVLAWVYRHREGEDLYDEFRK
jgi:predicted DNA-binding transcriptional regulator AlpA